MSNYKILPILLKEVARWCWEGVWPPPTVDHLELRYQNQDLPNVKVGEQPCFPPQISLLHLYLHNYPLYRFLVTIMSSHGGSRGGGWPKIDFEQYKDIIHNLYLVDCQSLDDVMRYMQSNHNFNLRYIIATLFNFKYVCILVNNIIDANLQ